MSTILVVDDDENSLETYNLLFAYKKHSVFSANSIQRAVELAHENIQIDVLVTDFHLKDGLGSELLEKLGDKLPNKKILITGDAHAIKYYSGFDFYLLKPVKIDYIYMLIEK